MENQGDDSRSDDVIVLSSGYSEYHVPKCDPSLKPYEGQKFKTIEDGIRFYKLYAAACGFDIRRGTRRRAIDGTEVTRYVYCNREGEKNSKCDDVDDCLIGVKRKRRRVSTRFKCKARVFFQLSHPHGYVVKRFTEQHSHTLVSDTFKKYLKANRNLDFVHQKFILNCARANIGPMKSYKLFKESVGDYSNIGCTISEFKNFSCDLRAYVLGVDAQMLIDKLFMKREVCSAFYFAYAVNNNDQLTRVFWADPIARKNYSIFGDVVSFDATYDTNRYKMIFTPFTGLDNHGKCVTFGAALLSAEDQESYIWALSKFKDCMGQGPRMIITDQDPALKIAVEHSLVGTRHRLCLWHIMLKIPEKVPSHLRKDELFHKRFNAIVWSDLIEPLEFEKEWSDIISDFGLVDNSWFTFMFGIREYWIPAYFRDFSFSGLFRTTSPSESVNHFYSGFLNKHSNLVWFFMQFESALDSQRHANERLNGADELSLPQLSTPLLFEKDAATIYTSQVFLKLQKAIESACYVCRIDKIFDLEATREYWVDDSETGLFKVVLNKVGSHDAADLKLSTIPEMYVVSRWTKRATYQPLHAINGSFQDQINVNEGNKVIMNELISEFYRCLALVDGNNEKMTHFLHGVKELQQIFLSADDSSPSVSFRKKLFDQYYGTCTPTEVFVLPPNQVKTKGSGSSLKSREEKKKEDMNKPLRRCSKCKQRTNHDARNCGKVIEE